MGKRLTKEDFIEKASIIHNNKYDYSFSNYINYMEKIEIRCSIHGSFLQTPNNHIGLKQGCPKCSNRYNYTTDEIISKFKEKHNKYDYSYVLYKNNYTKVRIICPIHGIFEQTPLNHLLGQGCPECNGKNRKSIQKFIEESNNIHNKKYNYSLVCYKNNNTKVKIICPEHGVFLQSPKCHIHRKQGCPHCKKSIGENIIEKTLIDNNIYFIKQKIFDKCVDKRKLPFDFYLPDYNTCIEYDGIQHFEVIEYWGGEDYYEYIKKHDNIKNNFCKNNNIKLLRIKYTRNLNSDNILKNIYDLYATK